VIKDRNWKLHETVHWESHIVTALAPEEPLTPDNPVIAGWIARKPRTNEIRVEMDDFTSIARAKDRKGQKRNMPQTRWVDLLSIVFGREALSRFMDGWIILAVGRARGWLRLPEQ
jgi:hypothetical protein